VYGVISGFQPAPASAEQDRLGDFLTRFSMGMREIARTDSERLTRWEVMSCREILPSQWCKGHHYHGRLAPRLFYDMQPTRARVRECARPPRAGLHLRRPGARRGGRGP
jgi:hypothetical protein